MKLMELRRRHAELIQRSREILETAQADGNRELTAEESANYDKCHEDIESTWRSIERAGRQEEAERRAAASQFAAGETEGGEEHRDRGGDETPMHVVDLSEMYRQKSQFVIPGAVNRLQITNSVELRAAFTRALAGDGEREYRALQQDSPTQAGYLVAPETFVAEVIADVTDRVHIRQKARKFLVGKAHSLGFPTRTARASTFAWGGELSEPTGDSSLAFGKREFIPRDFCGDMLVSRPLLRNAYINVDGYVRVELADDMARGQEQAFMTGSGANQPLGIFTASNDGIPTSRDVSTGAEATTPTVDNCMEVRWTLKEQYEAAAEWLMHRDFIKKINKLKDGEGRYLLQNDLHGRYEFTLLGFPVSRSEYAPNTATAGQYWSIFGDLGQYWIADGLGMEIQVLAELYARSNQVDYLYRGSVDGAPVKSEAFVRGKLAAG